MPGITRNISSCPEYWFNALTQNKNDLIQMVAAISGVKTMARPLRPEDLGGTAKQFYTTATAVTAVRVYGAGATQKVNTGQGISIIGWYAPEDFATAGYLDVQVEGITRNIVNAQFVYNQINNTSYTPDQIIMLKQNANFNVYLYNGQAANITSCAGPLGFIAGPPEQLLIGG